MSENTLYARLVQTGWSISSTGCWIWGGAMTYEGYGVVKFNGRQYRAHRAAYEAWHGPIANDAIICHKCDVRACVNPTHLYAGTHKTNAEDRENRNRSGVGQGETSHSNKLTAAQAREIYSRAWTGNETLKEIAADYQVHPGTVWAIKHKKSWRSIH